MKLLARHLRITSIVFICIVSLSMMSFISNIQAQQTEDHHNNAVLQMISADYQTAPFPDTPEGKMAAYGELLITETYAHIGPESQNPITGNRLACASCHLNGGTKPFAAPYIGLTGVFPIFIGREGKVESLEERVNGCLERSMNGKAIDVNSHEMRAMLTYMKHLSAGVPIGKRITGQGFTKFEPPARAANPLAGEKAYGKYCIACHGADGQGIRGTAGNREGGYIFPPLWGNDTFNDGAGMARLLTAARFIKGNMPLGVTAENPMLSDEEAYDVAAYINSHERPVMANKEKDYPDLTRKPKDSPYPPYADSIPQSQHKLGPYDFTK